MAEDAKKDKVLAPGMYECEKIIGKYKGEKVVYHSSTAQTLEAKGAVKVGKLIKNYHSPTHKK